MPICGKFGAPNWLVGVLELQFSVSAQHGVLPKIIFPSDLLTWYRIHSCLYHVMRRRSLLSISRTVWQTTCENSPQAGKAAA
jgi:hypothetical protein